LEDVLDVLGDKGITSVMVEGGTTVLTTFLRRQHVQRVVLTIAPMFVGGTPALECLLPEDTSEFEFPRLKNLQQRWAGDDLILEGDPVWPET
jgi:3,4-dihydroxy 2-butanone 4-phosphate synthase/GTP cyclohydrolase II